MTHWPSFLRELDTSERAWNTRNVRYPRQDAVPFLPFPIPDFIPLLAAAVMVAPCQLPEFGEFPPTTFLDIGAGTGTKIRLAQALFGLKGGGIEIVPEFVAEARARGIRVEAVDAFDFKGYGSVDIVYMNRPSTLMDELEGLVMEQMAPGAVLILVNGRNDPGKAGWLMVSQEFGEPVIGVWIKP